MEILFGKLVSVGVHNNEDVQDKQSYASERRVTMFELEMPIDRSGSISINVPSGAPEANCHIFEFDMLIDKWDNISPSNVLEIYMANAQHNYFLSVSMEGLPGGAVRLKTKAKNCIGGYSIIGAIPFGEWFNLHIEYYSQNDIARVYVNKAFIKNIGSNFENSDASTFGVVTFFATSAASYKYYLDNVRTYSVVREFTSDGANNDPPTCQSPATSFDDMPIMINKGSRSIIELVADPRNTAKRIISFDVLSTASFCVDGEEIPVESDMMICAKPGSTRSSRFPLKCYYMNLLLSEGVIYDELMRVPSHFPVNRTGRYRELFSKICKFYNSSYKADEIMLQSLVLELIYDIVTDSKRTDESDIGKSKQKGSAVAEKIAVIINYIKENLSQKLTLDQLATQVGYSPAYLHKAFKQATSSTLADYIKSERIKHAADLIVTTNYTLTQISYECGFSSQSYFSSAFKDYMGVTPREYERTFFENRKNK